MLHCWHCEPSVVSRVSRSSNAIEVSTKLAKHTFIAEHDTRPLGSCPVHVGLLSTEMKSFRNLLWVKKWLSCCVSTSKVELIAKTTSNCSQACLYTWYTSFFTSEALRNGCFLIDLSIAVPSLRVRRRLCDEFNLRSRHAARKPLLNPKQVTKRLHFCRK